MTGELSISDSFLLLSTDCILCFFLACFSYQSVTNNVIVKCDRIPETPNSINIKAQINHVPDPKPKNSTSAKRAQGTKRSLLSKLRYDESSDDDIISTPDNRNRPCYFQ
jgi:hypothetical protein